MLGESSCELTEKPVESGALTSEVSILHIAPVKEENSVFFIKGLFFTKGIRIDVCIYLWEPPDVFSGTMKDKLKSLTF